MTELSAMMTYSNYLEHAGVKGMKWGQRKQDSKVKPLSKAEKKRQKKTDTRNALLLVGGAAAVAGGGVYVANKITKGALISKVPKDVIRRGAAATTKTVANISNWRFVGGLNPVSIAATVGKEFVYNFMQTP